MSNILVSTGIKSNSTHLICGAIPIHMRLGLHAHNTATKRKPWTGLYLHPLFPSCPLLPTVDEPLQDCAEWHRNEAQLSSAQQRESNFVSSKKRLKDAIFFCTLRLRGHDEETEATQKKALALLLREGALTQS